MTNVFVDKNVFKEAFQTRVEQIYGIKFEESTPHQRYFTLGTLVREYISSNWIETNQAIVEGKHKQVYYFSMEFLMELLAYSIIATIFTAVTAVILIFAVVHCLGRAAMFKKAGEEPWAAWVPYRCRFR